MKIFFDMDGTIADLYSVENWLSMLIAEKTKPYETAKPMLNMSALARKLNSLQAAGHEIGIISWGSKKATDEYLDRIRVAKEKWLKKHLPSVKWDYIHVVHYGIPKYDVVNDASAVLFDDEENNRKVWRGIAYDEKNIMQILKNI